MRNFGDIPTPRIGPRMREVADYVRRHPGCRSREVQMYVAVSGEAADGYAIVARAVAAGLIRREYEPNGFTRLYSGMGHPQ